MSTLTQEVLAGGEADQPRQYSVWSDLRAMKFLAQVQQDMRSLKAANARLQTSLVLSVVILAGVTIALGTWLTLTHNQLQILRQQVPATPESAPAPRRDL